VYKIQWWRGRRGGITDDEEEKEKGKGAKADYEWVEQLNMLNSIA
jgi:hypothetical protein